MGDDEIKHLRLLLCQGRMIAWRFGDTIMPIIRIVNHDDEMKGVFADGRYVDLWNVDPDCIVVIEPAFTNDL